MNEIFFQAGTAELALLALPAFLVVTATAIVFSRDLLVCTAHLTIFSLVMAVIYLVLAAPDVAMTEAAVGAGVSTVLILAALVLVGRDTEAVSPRWQRIGFIVMAVPFVILCFVAGDLPALGDPAAPSTQYLAPDFLQRSEAEIGIPNVVTSILASYRGFDTFGEVSVVFTAAMALMLLLGPKAPAPGAGREKKDALAPPVRKEASHD